MRILVVSFYYRPDLSAGSFRCASIVDALRRALPPGSHIDVVTTLPNRYHSFSAEAPATEKAGGVTIFRVPLPRHKSGMLDQSRVFLTFARRALRIVKGRSYDLVFATSSRLMTAVLGSWIARRKKTRLYLDIRDIFVETIGDVLPRPAALPVRAVFGAVEKWALRRADRVNLVSPGFAPYFRDRYPGKDFAYFTNGIDEEFLTFSSKPARTNGTGRVVALYAGNIGAAQGLHVILPRLAKAMEKRVEFRVIGDGGRKEALRATLGQEGVTNVSLLAPMPRDQLLEAYAEADVLFLHLNDHKAFTRVLPSKVFEYAALDKPVWAGLAGFAADFVRREVPNAAVFHPCDAEDAIRAFSELHLQNESRAEFRSKFARAAISRSIAAEIVGVASAGARI